jgi:ATP-dependent RNA/DNA helicase IGHMBP2
MICSFMCHWTEYFVVIAVQIPVPVRRFIKLILSISATNFKIDQFPKPTRYSSKESTHNTNTNEKTQSKMKQDEDRRDLIKLINSNETNQYQYHAMLIESKIHDYILKQRRLLELELRSEQDENANANAKLKLKSNETTDNTTNKQEEGTRSSRILRNLQVDHLGVGLLGRTVVQFIPASDSHSQASDSRMEEEDDDDNKNGTKKDSSSRSLSLLPAHRLTVGDEVEIVTKLSQVKSSEVASSSSSSSSKRNKAGVISEVTDTSISIALYDNNSNHNHNHNQSHRKEKGKSDRKGKGKIKSGAADDPDNSEQGMDLVGGGWILVPRSSIQVHQKMLRVLDRLGKHGVNHDIAGRVIASIFENVPPDDPDSAENKSCSYSGSGSGGTEFTPFNPNLDESQTDAIQFALHGQQPVSLIHGPPGTGKTTTVAELIQQAVHVHKMRVLVTAPSNVAVDNVLERLVANQDAASASASTKHKDGQNKRIRAVRLGHPARIQPSILRYSLESLVQNADGTEIVNDIRSEMKAHLRVASNPKSRPLDKRTAYREMKLLRKELRQREGKVVESLLADAQVVLTTNVGAASHVLDKFENSSAGAGKPFDLVIIDEAAQALEVSCWVPILRGRRVVLAGDHRQLPPTIKSRHAEVQRELSKTMFERIMVRGLTVSRMLQVQYRMHRDIADWCSNAMYGGKLLSHDSVKARKLSHLPHVTNEHESYDKEESLLPTTMNATLLLVDTAGCDLFESVNGAGSRFNEGEADIVAKHVRNLMDIGMKPQDIAVITPYNGQVEILRRLLLEEYPKLEIRSVDGFQGGEREAVVLSLVRSSDRGKDGIGFLADKRRLNVAVTRAKRQCTVICDSDTVSQNSFLKDLVDWMEDHGEYLSAMEYIDEDPLVRTDHLEPSMLAGIGNTTAVNPNGATGEPGMDQDGEGIDMNVSLSEVESNRLKEDLAERICFFAEIADDGEEMEIELACVDAILNHVHSLCKEHKLQLRMNGKVAGQQVVTILKCDVISPDRKPIETFELVLSQFAKMSMIDEEYSLPVTLGVDITKLHNACDRLGLSCRSEPGNFVISHIHDASKEASRHPENIAPTRPSSVVNDLLDDKEKQLDEQRQHTDCEQETPNVIIDRNHNIPMKEGATSEGKGDTKQDSATNMNSLLGALARERAARAGKSVDMKKAEPSKKSKKSKSTKGKKAGAGGPKTIKSKAKEDTSDDNLDDLAFLDAQIEKVQTSHGRKIEASGSAYKSIVNGILIAKPKPKEKKRNTNAVNALNSKMKQAQQSRRAKPKQKK